MDRKSDDRVEAGIEIVEDGGGCLCTAEGDTLETTVQHGASGMLEDVDSGLQVRDGCYATTRANTPTCTLHVLLTKASVQIYRVEDSLGPRVPRRNTVLR